MMFIKCTSVKTTAMGEPTEELDGVSYINVDKIVTMNILDGGYALFALSNGSLVYVDKESLVPLTKDELKKEIWSL